MLHQERRWRQMSRTKQPVNTKYIEITVGHQAAYEYRIHRNNFRVYRYGINSESEIMINTFKNAIK